MDQRRPRFPVPPDEPTLVGEPRGPAPLRPGSVLAHTYRIEASLAGSSRTAETYRARHIELDTPHAIKIIPPALAANPQLIELLAAEVRKLNGVRNDAVVSYETLLRDEHGVRFLVTELVEGETLQAVMARSRLEPEQVLRLRDRLAQGLAEVHGRGIIHRDICPENIVLADGDVSRAKLTNFGIARSMDPGDATLIGVDVIAQHSYGSPEQFGLFGGRVDSRSDIYSLGLVLAAAAIGFGKSLEMGSSASTMIAARQRVPDLSAVAPELRPVIAPMLEPNPEGRPPSMRALLDQRPATVPAQVSAPHSGRRNTAVFGILVAVVAVVAMGFLAPRILTPPASNDDLVAKLAAVVTGYQCASLNYALAPDRTAEISGRIASAEELDRLKGEAASIRGIRAINMKVELVGRPHCDVVALLTPLEHKVPAGSPTLEFVAKAAEPRIGDRLALDIRTPGFDGYIYVDYFDRGGQVLHLFPNGRDFFNFRPARNHFVIFKPPLSSCWTFNGSAGQEMFAIIATPQPLLPMARPEIEAIRDYLADLGPAIQRLPQGNGAAATLLFTLGEAARWVSGGTACPS